MISVCIATYNGELFIKEQLASILIQLSPNDEVIVSDNGSSDNTIAIVNGFSDSRIKVYQFPRKTKNLRFNIIRNFENALVKATGDIIVLSDQDDIWLTNKIETIKKALINDKYDLIVTDCQIIDKNNQIIYPSFFEKNYSGKGLIKNLKHNSYLGCCMAFNKKVLKKVLPFPMYIPMHDIWIGFVAELCSFKVIFSTQVTTGYRYHSNNITSASTFKSTYSIFKKLKFRFNLLRYSVRVLFR